VQFSAANPARSIGHNPLGGWSVLALLLSLAVQVVSGLFTSDGIDNEGPLAAHVASRWVKLMTRVHGWNENVLLLLIVLHVVAVLLYTLLGRDNLIAPMVSGRKRVQGVALRFVSAWRALLVLGVAVGAVALLLAWA
jgi:cytochrome b